jgi:hypothetical protein
MTSSIHLGSKHLTINQFRFGFESFCQKKWFSSFVCLKIVKILTWCVTTFWSKTEVLVIFHDELPSSWFKMPDYYSTLFWGLEFGYFVKKHL